MKILHVFKLWMETATKLDKWWLSNYSGISQMYLTHIAKGRKNPKFERWLQIINACERVRYSSSTQLPKMDRGFISSCANCQYYLLRNKRR